MKTKILVFISFLILVLLMYRYINQNHSASKVTLLNKQSSLFDAEKKPEKYPVKGVTEEDAGAVKEGNSAYIFSCVNNGFSVDDKLLNPNVERFSDYRYWSEKLALLDDEKHAFTLLMLPFEQEVTSKESSVDLIKGLVNKYPQNKMINFELLNRCAIKSNSQNCSLSDELNAINSDSNNAAVWINAAILRANKNDFEGVKEALIKIHTSPMYQDYSNVRFAAFESSLLDIGLVKPSIRLIAAMGLEAAYPLSNTTALIKFCEGDTSRNKITSLNCLEAGKRIELDATSNLFKLFGINLQNTASQVLNEENIINESLNNNTRGLNKEEGDAWFKMVELALFDESLAQYWIDNYKLYGETVTADKVVDEAIRLSSYKNYNPCSD